MKIPVECEACGASFSAAVEHAGRTGSCPKCEEPITVPAAASAPAAPRAAPSTVDPADVELAGDMGVDEHPTVNLPAAIGASAGAAILGALIWAGLRLFVGVEVGWVAIGIGAGTGGAMTFFGARGFPLGGVAAVFALIGIVLGKAIGVQVGFEAGMQEARDAAVEQFQVERDTYLRNQEVFAALPENPTDEDLRVFMFQRNFTNVTRTEDISDAALEEFREQAIPYLQDRAAEPPTEEEWMRSEWEPREASLREEFTTFDAIVGELSWIDHLFAAFGIGWALRMVAVAEQSDRDQRMAARRVRRASRRPRQRRSG